MAHHNILKSMGEAWRKKQENLEALQKGQQAK
jgi:hypothetical protein